MVLAGGVFYQTSYDGTEVAITTDYPGLLPISRVSNQETPPFKRVLLFCLTHRTVSCFTGETFGDFEEISSRTGQAFEEEGG